MSPPGLYPLMVPAAAARLHDYFAPYNAALQSLLGDFPGC
jgi:N-formylglutamate amidohydrolase